VAKPSIFDLHSDLFYRVLDYGLRIDEAPAWAQSSLPLLEAGGVREQVFAIWVDGVRFPGASATVRARELLRVAHENFARHPSRLTHVTTMAEADAVAANGRIAAFLWLEGGAPIGEDLDLLHEFHRAGIRGMTLTWTTNLPWAGSSTDPHDPNRGLLPFGRDVVREMNQLGWLVDISHASDRCAQDAINVSRTPVIATHSGCRALANTPRNISDELLRQLGDTGGLVGILAVPQFLRLEWEPAWDAAAARHAAEIAELERNLPTADYRGARSALLQKALPPEAVVSLDHFVDHVLHAVAVAGVEHVALGSDFDGMWAHTVGLESAAGWPAVLARLRARGLSEYEVDAIAGNNARRLFREILTAR
jgi:membrane dipeptidase